MALPPRICWTQCICYSTLFPVLSGRYFTALASPNSCNLNGKPGFIFTTSWLHGFLEHTFWRDCPVKCLLTSASNWTIEGGIYNPPTFNYIIFLTYNLLSCIITVSPPSTTPSFSSYFRSPKDQLTICFLCFHISPPRDTHWTWPYMIQ